MKITKFAATSLCAVTLLSVGAPIATNNTNGVAMAAKKKATHKKKAAPKKKTTHKKATTHKAAPKKAAVKKSAHKKKAVTHKKASKPKIVPVDLSKTLKSKPKTKRSSTKNLSSKPINWNKVNLNDYNITLSGKKASTVNKAVNDAKNINDISNFTSLQSKEGTTKMGVVNDGKSLTTLAEHWNKPKTITLDHNAYMYNTSTNNFDGTIGAVQDTKNRPMDIKAGQKLEAVGYRYFNGQPYYLVRDNSKLKLKGTYSGGRADLFYVKASNTKDPLIRYQLNFDNKGATNSSSINSSSVKKAMGTKSPVKVTKTKTATKRSDVKKLSSKPTKKMSKKQKALNNLAQKMLFETSKNQAALNATITENTAKYQNLLANGSKAIKIPNKIMTTASGTTNPKEGNSNKASSNNSQHERNYFTTDNIVSPGYDTDANTYGGVSDDNNDSKFVANQESPLYVWHNGQMVNVTEAAKDKQPQVTTETPKLSVPNNAKKVVMKDVGEAYISSSSESTGGKVLINSTPVQNGTQEKLTFDGDGQATIKRRDNNGNVETVKMSYHPAPVVHSIKTITTDNINTYPTKNILRLNVSNKWAGHGNAVDSHIVAIDNNGKTIIDSTIRNTTATTSSPVQKYVQRVMKDSPKVQYNFVQSPRAVTTTGLPPKTINPIKYSVRSFDKKGNMTVTSSIISVDGKESAPTVTTTAYKDLNEADKKAADEAMKHPIVTTKPATPTNSGSTKLVSTKATNSVPTLKANMFAANKTVVAPVKNDQKLATVDNSKASLTKENPVKVSGKTDKDVISYTVRFVDKTQPAGQQVMSTYTVSGKEGDKNHWDITPIIQDYENNGYSIDSNSYPINSTFTSDKQNKVFDVSFTHANKPWAELSGEAIANIHLDKDGELSLEPISNNEYSLSEKGANYGVKGIGTSIKAGTGIDSAKPSIKGGKLYLKLTKDGIVFYTPMKDGLKSIKVNK